MIVWHVPRRTEDRPRFDVWGNEYCGNPYSKSIEAKPSFSGITLRIRWLCRWRFDVVIATAVFIKRNYQQHAVPIFAPANRLPDTQKKLFPQTHVVRRMFVIGCNLETWLHARVLGQCPVSAVFLELLHPVEMRLQQRVPQLRKLQQ